MGLLAAPVAMGGQKGLSDEGVTLPNAFGLEDPPSDPRGLPARADNMELVGSLQIPGVEVGQIADVAVHKGFAYLNSWDDAECEGGGTYVVDIRNPASPQLVTFIPAPANMYHGEGAHVVSVNVTGGFKGDILAVNDETYGSNVTGTCSDALDQTTGGFDLYDVTDPANPKALVQGAGDRDEDNDPETEPRELANSYHSVFAWQNGNSVYLVASDNAELTDVDIFDITDPTAPNQVGDHDLAALFPEILDGEQANGSLVLHHDVVVKQIGGKPIMKADYWDAGYVQMDVSDPANPVLVTDTTFAGEDPLLPGTGLTPEGNAHQGEFSFDNQFLLTADEDFSAFRNVVRALDGPTSGKAATGAEGDAVARISGLADGKLNGPSTFVGNGCDPATITQAPTPDDPATDDIALVERGGTLPDGTTSCGFADKFDNAQAAGWDGIIIFNQVRPDDGQVNMLTGEGGIPGVQMRRVDAFGPNGVLSAGDATPAPGTAGPTIEIGQEFDGWGYASLYDAKTSERIDSYAIPESLDPRYADGFGDLSIHEFATDPAKPLAYAAYYGGGMRVFGFSRANGLEPKGAWIAPGGSNFWGVEQFTSAAGERLIAGSDRDFGLVILRYTGEDAATARCADATASTTAGTPVQVALSCTDANGNPIGGRTVTGAPTNGTAAVGGDTLTYTPNAGFTGKDTVRFATSAGPAATVTITVTPAPVPDNKVKSVKVGKYKKGRLPVQVEVPGPGRVAVSLSANLPRAKKGRASAVVRLARVSRNVTQAGTVRMTLRLSKSERKRVQQAAKGRKRVRMTVATAFTPTGGTTATTRRTLRVG